MLRFLVLGQIPGVELQVTYNQLLFISVVLLLIVRFNMHKKQATIQNKISKKQINKVAL